MTLRIFPISDLHLEFYDIDLGTMRIEEWSTHLPFLNVLPAPEDIDVLVLAGDIGQPMPCDADADRDPNNLECLLRYLAKRYEHVIMVPGNHEYYRSPKISNTNQDEQDDEFAEFLNLYTAQTPIYDRSAPLSRLRKMCQDTGVILLDKKMVCVRNVAFFGTTLWSKITEIAAWCMNDFQTAFSSPEEYRKEHYACHQWLIDSLANKSCNSAVVITHHLPSLALIHPRYANNPMNSGFATDILGSTLNLSGVKLWICGHTHESAEMQRGSTTFVVNPFGYPKEKQQRPCTSKVYEIVIQ